MAKKKAKKKVTKKKTAKRLKKSGAPQNKKMNFVDKPVDPVDIPRQEDLQDDFEYETKSTLQTEGL